MASINKYFIDGYECRKLFHVVKDIFRFRKLPYKGIAKNRTRLLVSYANANLYMLTTAGRRLCPLSG